MEVGVTVGVSVGKGVRVDVAVGVANQSVTELKLHAEDDANGIATRKVSTKFLVFIFAAALPPTAAAPAHLPGFGPHTVNHRNLFHHHTICRLCSP